MRSQPWRARRPNRDSRHRAGRGALRSPYLRGVGMAPLNCHISVLYPPTPSCRTDCKRGDGLVSRTHACGSRLSTVDTLSGLLLNPHLTSPAHRTRPLSHTTPPTCEMKAVCSWSSRSGRSLHTRASQEVPYEGGITFTPRPAAAHPGRPEDARRARSTRFHPSGCRRRLPGCQIFNRRNWSGFGPALTPAAHAGAKNSKPLVSPRQERLRERRA